ncbi:hypothetical protein NIES932_14580 [Raphidiopsis curvata NIES-932]|nr:hypothetical protein NIES932_14520 [Raphidiopsis curvata NIES-932]BAZ89973.1 hypothetical protein NIES932_14580 [Raphidiopsis curvata NIES-932]
MPKHFNTAGPCQSDIHYMLSSAGRLPQLKALIDGRNYFIIHAPRQVGKTTAMISLAQQLTDSGEYTAVMLSVEVGSVFPDEPERAERAILGSWQDAIDIWLPEDLHPHFDPERREGQSIGTFLKSWAKSSPRPLVVFIDEIDSLQNQTLISVLRQLRDGFPHSLGLIGMRDVRDYKVKSSGSERKSDPLTKGLTQLDKYLDGLGLHTGWLVIFDRRPGLPPMGERISTEEVISPSGRTITVIRS